MCIIPSLSQDHSIRKWRHDLDIARFLALSLLIVSVQTNPHIDVEIYTER